MPPSSQPGVPPKRHLASKESALFKELLNLYETRQLKKGLKTAETILKKYPEHGGEFSTHLSGIPTQGSASETLCMKGLVLVHLGRREEGIETVKKGMRFDLTSHICWHVFGLIQKGEKNYEEALKSYNMALRFDKVRITTQVSRYQISHRASHRKISIFYEIRHIYMHNLETSIVSWISVTRYSKFDQTSDKIGWGWLLHTISMGP